MALFSDSDSDQVEINCTFNIMQPSYLWVTKCQKVEDFICWVASGVQHSIEFFLGDITMK
jgi:hypothetical protein